MSAEFSNLNEIPVKTFRWLGINNISIKDFPVPEVGNFKTKHTSTDNDYYNLSFTHINLPEIIDTGKENYGISKEVIKEINENSNSSFLLHIKKVNKEPIILNFQFDENNKSLLDENLIIGDEGSEAHIVLYYSSTDNSVNYHNGLIKVLANKNSKINLYIIQKLNKRSINLISSLSSIDSEGEVNYSFIDLGSKYSISSYHSFLNGDGGISNLDSLYLGEGDKTIDINYLILHKGRKTKSQMKTQGALLGRSKKIFRGTLDFRKGASKAIGKEEEYVMLLSPEVKNSSIPLLLSREDDIQGEHAASAGKIEENTLFYLMSRGLSLEESKKLLILSHFNPIINRLPEELRKDIISSIERKLENA